VRSELPARSQRRSEGVVIDEYREMAASGRVLVKRVVVRPPDRESIEYEERVRLYDPHDLTAMLRGASLVVRAVHGDYDLGPFDPTASARVIMVCEKSGEG
jgi:hypothetical protein